jgi:hypothetical protein
MKFNVASELACQTRSSISDSYIFASYSFKYLTYNINYYHYHHHHHYYILFLRTSNLSTDFIYLKYEHNLKVLHRQVYNC